MAAEPLARRVTTTLTKRERQVLDLISVGYRNKEIARALGLSVRTIKVHVHHLLQKTGAQHRWHAVVLQRQGEASA